MGGQQRAADQQRDDQERDEGHGRDHDERRRLAFALFGDLGQVLDLDLDGVDGPGGRRRIEEMCARLLVNPVIEEFAVEMEDA